VKKITGESEIYKVFKKREKKLVFQKQFRQKHFFEAFFVIDNRTKKIKSRIFFLSSRTF